MMTIHLEMQTSLNHSFGIRFVFHCTASMTSVKSKINLTFLFTEKREGGESKSDRARTYGKRQSKNDGEQGEVFIS